MSANGQTLLAALMLRMRRDRYHPTAEDLMALRMTGVTKRDVEAAFVLDKDDVIFQNALQLLSQL